MKNEIEFSAWASLIMKAYKENGHWAVLMPIITAFRSYITDTQGFCTTLFLCGPCASGKSTFAESIASVFGKPVTFNLGSRTDAAFFSALEEFKGIVITEEYDDIRITDNKFQLLKASVTDGTSRGVRYHSGRVETFKVNATPLILGHGMPERDDLSLFDRVIFLPFSQLNPTVQETKDFIESKKYDRILSSNVLNDILKIESSMHLYGSYVKSCFYDLSTQFKYFPYRKIRAVALFAGMVKMIEQENLILNLPFSYKDFFSIALKNLSEAQVIYTEQ